MWSTCALLNKHAFSCKSIQPRFQPRALVIVRSLSGKNWQDRYKVSISFPATPNEKLNVFGDVMKIFEKFISWGGGVGGEKLLF